MAIGIVDLDLIISPSAYKLNLDVMQISSYYKQKGEKVHLCKSMAPEDLMWLNQLIVIYNGEKEIFIDRLLSDDRVTLVGKYFYGKNLTLSQEILDSYPDRSIYDNIIESNFFSQTKRVPLRQLLKNADFVRLHIPSNLNFISEISKELFIYDQDITDKDYELIVSLNKPFSIYYPIEVRNYKEADKWISAKAFKRGDTTHMFLANRFVEEDLNKIIKQPISVRRMFKIKFGSCEPQNYNFELKKMLRFLSKAKLLEPQPKIIIADIADPLYNFLYNSIRRWYNGKKNNLYKDIFHTYCKTKEQYEFINRIKLTDSELYKLLTSTMTTRYQDEQTKSDYRRLD